MSDYKDIIRKPETLNWFKAAVGINITLDCLLDIVKQGTQELYHTIRKEINRKHGIPENVVCSHCNTPNVLPCDADNQCCKYRKCAFHEIHKPRNCPSNYLCNEICKEIVDHHRFRNRSKTISFRGPTWVNTDACQWCANPWQIAKCYLSKEGYKGVNKAEEADFNGIVNVIYNCEFFQRYFTDDLTQKQNVCTKARDVRQAVCHSSSMSMASEDNDRAMDTLVALLQSLKCVDHQAAANTAVGKLTQLKNNTLVITDEDVAKTFETFKESLTEEIKRMLLNEKDKLVKNMEEALKNIGKHITAEIIKAGDEQIARIKRTCEDDLGINSRRSMKDLDTDKHSGKSGDDIAPGAAIESPIARGSPLFKIQRSLIEQYRAMCVVPVSMLDSDIDVPLERIYVPPSINALKRGRKDRHGGSETDKTLSMESDVSCYKKLLNCDGNPVNTIYIQGDPGCGKTTFSTKLVLDWCKAHSKNGASTKKKITINASTSEGTSKQTHFSDLDTLREYTFLFFVSLRDYSGTMCNVSQMVEDAIKSNKLAWDDSVWDHKCIVLTDAADEWYHSEIPFPPPCDSACKCRKDRSMPQYLLRSNITNIITARPWKLANLSMSDTLTRMLEISGVTNYKTLAENVINVLAEKDGISKNDQQSKCIYFFDKIEAHSLDNLITIPAVCVQLAHQFYVGRLMEGSRCAIYINMLDMHIAKGLQKLQIKEFDSEEICVKEITQIFGTESTEYLRDNGSLVRSASALAFKTLTDSSNESSLVFSEKTITNHMAKTTLDYLLQTGIITKKKSLALSSQKNVPYMFVHKTIQEFLASLYITMNQTDIEDILNAIQSVYCDGESILDIDQLFIFTCGLCPQAAERLSKHIMDVITRDMESKLQSNPELTNPLMWVAHEIVIDGFMEGVANKQPCLQLTLSHVHLDILEHRDYQMNKEIEYKHAFNTLIDMNISNIISVDARYLDSSQQNSYRVQEIISQSRESLSSMTLYQAGQLDLKGLKLKYFSCCGDSDISNLDCTYMRACEFYALTPFSQERILQSMSVTGKNIRYLKLNFVESIDLLCAALPNLTSLHTLIIEWTELAVTQLYNLPESIRKVVYEYVHVSAQDVKSMVEWSKSRDACVCCEFRECFKPEDWTDICNLMKQQDGIDITRCEFKTIAWSTISSK